MCIRDSLYIPQVTPYIFCDIPHADQQLHVSLHLLVVLLALDKRRYQEHNREVYAAKRFEQGNPLPEGPRAMFIPKRVFGVEDVYKRQT